MAYPDPRAYRILTERFELSCYREADAEEFAGSPAASAAYEAFDDQGRPLGAGT